MNVVDCRSWLTDRESELESKRSELASLQVQLSDAEQAFSKTNGDLVKFTQVRDLLEHLRHRVVQTQQAVKTCESNVVTARECLARAERDKRIAELKETRSERQSRMRVIAEDAAAHYRAAIGALNDLELCQVDEDREFEDLRRLDQSAATRIHALHSLWLALMNALPDRVPANFAELSNFEKKPFDDNAAKIFEMTGPAWYGCPWPTYKAQARQLCGDTEATLPVLPAPDPPKRPVQEVDQRDGITVKFFRGIEFRVETWVLAPDCRKERRLLLQDSLPFGATIISDELVTLEHGLTARFVKIDGGREMLLAPAKTSLASRVVDGARELLGLTADQSPSL